jgi:hypothetical protein
MPKDYDLERELEKSAYLHDKTDCAEFDEYVKAAESDPCFAKDYADSAAMGQPEPISGYNDRRGE